MTDRYTLIGNPVSHSRSPQIHAAFALQTGQDLQYDTTLAPVEPAGVFESMARAFFEAGGRGMNVTVPFKVRAMALTSRLTPRAAAAGAVNTLAIGDEGLIGDNTDGAGLVGDVVSRMAVSLTGAQVLLIGAGGAARGVLLPLLDAGAGHVVIANRTLANARKIVADLVCRMPVLEGRIEAIDLQQMNARRAWADVIINATSAGLPPTGAPSGERTLPVGFALEPEVFRLCRIACDMVYGARPTAFLEAAREAGVGKVADGLGMLVGQAAESFLRWRGVRPDVEPVLARLRADLRGATDGA